MSQTKNTKILCNLCLHFARQDGQDGKKRKENHATKVTKIPKTKRRKYGMNETYVNVITAFSFITYFAPLFATFSTKCPHNPISHVFQLRLL